MKKFATILAILLSTVINAQSLNSNAQLIKEKSPEDFKKIELIVGQNYDKSESMYTIMINTQADALYNYLTTPNPNTKEEEATLLNMYEFNTSIIDGIKCTNWALLMIMLEQKGYKTE